MVILSIRNLTFEGHHGVGAEERACLQPFLVAVELRLDKTDACQSDCLDDTVNWASVRNVAKGVIEGPPRFLIEALTQDLTDGLFNFAAVQWVRVKIEKLAAWDNGIPGITIEQER